VESFELSLMDRNGVTHWIVFGTDPKAAYEVVKLVRETTIKPLIVKLSPNVTDVVEMASACADAVLWAQSRISQGDRPTTSTREGHCTEAIPRATDRSGMFQPRSQSTSTVASATAAPTSNESSYIEYTVQKGDLLNSIAKKYNVTTKDILAINRISNADSLTVGQVIRIPKVSG
jgi:LysM repeat protein